MFMEKLEDRLSLSAGSGILPTLFRVVPAANTDPTSVQPTVEFGLVNGRYVRKTSAVAADGRLLSFSLSGRGTGQAFADGGGFRLSLSGTDARSALTVSSSSLGGLLTGISVGGALKSLSAKTCTVGGDVSTSGPLGRATSFALSSASGSTIHFTIGSGGLPTDITAALVSDVILYSPSTIQSLVVGQWLNLNPDPDLITASSIRKLAVTGGRGIPGNFGADIRLGPNPLALRSLTIKGAFQNATIWAAGGIGTAKIGSMSGSNIYLGVDPNGATAPAGFIQVSTLGSLTLTGPGTAFYDSNIVVPRISSLRLGKVADVVTTQFQFGIQANFIDAYIRKTQSGGSIQYHKVDVPGEFDNVGTAFSARIV